MQADVLFCVAMSCLALLSPHYLLHFYFSFLPVSSPFPLLQFPFSLFLYPSPPPLYSLLTSCNLHLPLRPLLPSPPVSFTLGGGDNSTPRRRQHQSISAAAPSVRTAPFVHTCQEHGARWRPYRGCQVSLLSYPHTHTLLSVTFTEDTVWLILRQSPFPPLFLPSILPSTFPFFFPAFLLFFVFL
jgi:hypothetical protein